MKSANKTFGVLLAAAVTMTVTLRADDTTNSAATGSSQPVASTTATKPATGGVDELFDSVIVKGKNFELKRSQYDEAVNGIKATASARGQDLNAGQLAMYERQVLDRLIQIKIFNDKATDADRAKGAAEADKRLDLIKKRAPSQEVLDRQLKSMGLTLDELRKRLVEETVAETVLFNKVTVTDDQIKKFYNENPSQFEQPEQVRASHILLMTVDPKTHEPLPDDDKKAKRTQIEDLLKRARAGEDFAKLAKQYSEDPGSRDNGGEYTFPRGQMAPEFEAAAFSLQTNQISDVVTTVYGYHIIKLSEKIPAHREELSKDVSSQIRDYLQKKELDKLMPQMYADLKKEYHVEILDDDLKALEESGDSGDFGAAPVAPKSDAGATGGNSSTNK